MSDFLKGLKVKNSTAGRLLTTDSNGKIISSDISVDDINDLETRVNDLETNMVNVSERLSDING